MSDTRFDVTGIGNAIVDVLAQSQVSFIEEHGLDKGMMTLIDAETADRLYGVM
ncbi:MAG: adenosine kinase, partial [Rhodospirillales bacterium]|nr:adenosine kinase [Rhodospirillales bacterium]